jgi:hypothetical protein
VHWASGLPGGVFAKVLPTPPDGASASRCLITIR